MSSVYSHSEKRRYIFLIIDIEEPAKLLLLRLHLKNETYTICHYPIYRNLNSQTSELTGLNSKFSKSSTILKFRCCQFITNKGIPKFGHFAQKTQLKNLCKKNFAHVAQTKEFVLLHW